MKNMDGKLLNDFEENYLQSKKRRMIRYLIIGGVSISIIVIVIILVVALNGDNSNGNKEVDNNQNNNGNKEENNNQNKNEEKEEDNNPNKKEEEEENQEENENPSDSCPEIKKIENGLKGSGFASRYWDCCRPSCSWTDNAGSGNEARHCDKKMNLLSDLYSQSICEGGPSTTCLSQIPFTIKGCDDIGFAFAAVPTYIDKICGKCFLLQFNGSGKYESRKGHTLLKNKKLIVMATNVGRDVSSGQFDVMIPGGGVGIYNGCNEILGNNLGKQYGGLLSDCEEEVGYSYDDNTIYNKRKECLINKCNNIFNSKSLAKEGCLFLANFLEAAGNPNHDFIEIECPKVLKERY